MSLIWHGMPWGTSWPCARPPVLRDNGRAGRHLSLIWHGHDHTGRAGRHLSLIWHGHDHILGLIWAMRHVVRVLPSAKDQATLEPDLAG